MKDLLGAVTMGVAEEDLFLSLANRLIRLEKQITEKEKDKLLEYSGGKNLKQITKELLSAFDEDEIEEKAKPIIKSNSNSRPHTSEKEEHARKEAQQELIDTGR